MTDTRQLLMYVGGAFVVLLLVLLLLPEKQSAEDERVLDGTEHLTTTGEGGFPVPPMDLQVPPTPRSLQRTAVTSGAGSGTPAPEERA